MNRIVLSQADMRRLEKLAQAAGYMPRSVLKHVSQAVRIVTARMQTNQGIANEDAMRQLDCHCMRQRRHYPARE